MFIEITQADNFNWISVLVTFVTTTISAGLGACHIFF